MPANLEIAILDPVHNNHPALPAGSLTVSGSVASPKDADEIQVDGWIVVLGFPVALLAGPTYVPAPGGPPPQGSWKLDFQNVPPGMHQLVVRATAQDEEGNYYYCNDEILINVADEHAAAEEEEAPKKLRAPKAKPVRGQRKR
jgi:hypothetical protein